MTIREKLIQALKAHGFREVRHPTRRYVVFQRGADFYNLIFVGKAGALRAGPNVGLSVPIEATKRSLLATGKF